MSKRQRDILKYSAMSDDEWIKSFSYILRGIIREKSFTSQIIHDDLKYEV
jgi:hypothetical protein